jgi:hypothetical protein
LTEKTAKLLWTDESESSFNSLKDKLTQAPILVYPCIHKRFILDTDTSGFGIAAVLSQSYDGLERPVAYFSRSLNKHERNYCVTLSSVHNNLAVFSVNLLRGLAMSENEGMNLR